MTGETILIVEDEPESLKYNAAVLRSAGYKVQIASTAEQAWSTLRFTLPDLILVDFILPGMSGLELTSRIKQDPRLRKSLVLGLTAAGQPDDEYRARQAGCAGYLIKPIEARELAARIREYLDYGGPAPTSGSPAPTSTGGTIGMPPQELEELRNSFLTSGKVLSRQLLISLDGKFDQAKTVRMVHQWVETGTLLGLQEIANWAREVDVVLQTPPWNIGRLRGPVTNLARAFRNAMVDGTDPTTQSMVRALTGKRVGMIGLADVDAERMCGVLEEVGARAFIFPADQSPYVGGVADCNVLLVHARTATRTSRWLAPDAIALPAIPTILLGEPQVLLGLDYKVHTRACGLLTDGWLPEEGMMRLRAALVHSAPHHAADPDSGEIVIADSDEMSRAAVRTLMEKQGFPCRMAANGPDTILLLRALRPAVAVLDAEMDGFEVQALIRAEALPVRTILIIPQQQEQEILRAFSLGVEDFVAQPFSAVELVARLKRLMATAYM